MERAVETFIPDLEARGFNPPSNNTLSWMRYLTDEQRQWVFTKGMEHEPDTPLTEMGQAQAKGLRSDEYVQKKAQLIVASTQRRALHTAQLGFGDLLAKGKARGVVLEEAREFLNSGERRHPVSAWRKAVEAGLLDKNWDFSLATEEDQICDDLSLREIPDMNDPDFNPGQMMPQEKSLGGQRVRARARRVVRFLMAQPEEEIVVVSHGGFTSQGLLGAGTLCENSQAMLKEGKVAT